MASSSWRAFRSLVMLATLGMITLSACFWSDVRGIGASLRAMVADQVPGLAERMPWLEEGVEADSVNAPPGPVAAMSETFEPFAAGAENASGEAPSVSAGGPNPIDRENQLAAASPGDAWPQQEVPAIAQPRPPVRAATSAVEAGAGAEENKEHADETARLRRAEARLQNLGAQHYLLEGWGPAGELYRFECQMSIPGEEGAHRHFEATKAQPLAAVEAVLADVEAWQQEWRR